LQKGTSSATVGKKEVFLFDFDGVICDSCDECSVAGLRALIALGVAPEELSADEALPKWLLIKMRQIRPAIEVGWQIPVLLAVVVEQELAALEGGKKAMTADEIASDYRRLISETLEGWGKSEQDLINAFGDARDRWMVDDMASWLASNRFYDDVPPIISECRGNALVVTTKQQRFAIALMRHAGISDTALPNDRIYGLGMYKNKMDVIADHMAVCELEPNNVHFFEDRWPTLVKCLADERLVGVQFYLCGWGYCTEEEVAAARLEERVRVLEKAEDLEGVTM